MSKEKIWCPSCQIELDPENPICPRCVAGKTPPEKSSQTEDPDSENEEKGHSENFQAPTVLPNLDIDEMERNVPWNGILLALMILFLLMTTFNR